MALAKARDDTRNAEAERRQGAEREALRLVPVEDKRTLDSFIRLPWRIYQDDPSWVPPLILERREHLSPKANPYFRHAEAQLWLAFRGKRPVGRISAQVDRAALAQHQDATGHFGFLEAEDDSEVFAKLLETAEAWLRERDMTQVRGPFSFSINDESGLLVEGFDRPPSLMMGHARPYYASRLEACGYRKVMDLIAYDYDIAKEPLPTSAQALIERLEKDPRVELRKLDKSRFAAELDAVLAVFNDAWSRNWGFVPFTPEEIAKAAKDLKPLIEADFVAIAEVDGEAAAFAIALPNLNEAIADLNGALLPFGWAKLLYRLKFGKIKTGRMPLMGVRRKYHGTPLGAALAYAVIGRVQQAMKRRGYRGGELSWILEDNVSTRRIIESTGAVAYKTYRIYEKALS
jgi:hypothetical protein